MAATKTARQVRTDYRTLKTHYPEAHCALNYTSAWELLVATILSAQCTDVRVNQVTPPLFERFPTVEAMAAAEPDEVEELIRSTGFFRNKAKGLVGSARVIVEDYDGEVPSGLQQLTALPGVGRKTANVVRGNAFDLPGMVVDTHVGRLARRLGWTVEKDPVKVEKDLCRLLPPEDWTMCGHVLIAHGRAVCKAPTPICSECVVVERCPQTGVGKMK